MDRVGPYAADKRHAEHTVIKAHRGLQIHGRQSHMVSTAPAWTV